jgi:glyoxylase-like metal-dependent hydrolase (beta-lactamase superfamily II)
MTFGDFKLKFHPAPGHSRCSIITEINGKILQIGDLLMINVDRKNTLPYIADGGGFIEHIKSLELIKKLDPEAIIVPHGGFIDNKKRISDLVDDRVFYLEQVLNSKGALPVEKCLKNDISWYDNLEFHDINLIHLF